MKAATKAPVAERPEAPDADPKEPKRSQFEQFAEVVVAKKQEFEKATEARAAVFEVKDKHEKEFRRLQGLAEQVRDPNSTFTLDKVVGETTKERVRLMVTPPEVDVRLALKARFLDDPKRVSPEQARFCRFITAAPMALENQQALDKLKGRRLTDKEQKKYDNLRKGLISFNHTLRVIVQDSDGSFTRDQLIRWMAGVGKWPEDKARQRIAGTVAEIIGFDVASKMSDVAKVAHPTIEEDADGVDLYITTVHGRKYAVDFKSGTQKPDPNDESRLKHSVVKIGINSEWVSGLGVRESKRREVEQHIRSECNMPTLVD